MRADLFSLDAVRAGREQRVTHAPGRAAGLSAALVGASLAIIACGVLAAVLWFVWILAETLS